VSNGSHDPNGTNSLDVHVGRYSATIKGATTLLVVSMLAIVSSTIYIGWRIEQAVQIHDRMRADQIQTQTNDLLKLYREEASHRMAEHNRMSQDQRILACILTLSHSAREVISKQQRIEWSMICPGIMGS